MQFPILFFLLLLLQLLVPLLIRLVFVPLLVLQIYLILLSHVWQLPLVEFIERFLDANLLYGHWHLS